MMPENCTFLGRALNGNYRNVCVSWMTNTVLQTNALECVSAFVHTSPYITTVSPLTQANMNNMTQY